jgi:hypothetical protein
MIILTDGHPVPLALGDLTNTVEYDEVVLAPIIHPKDKLITGHVLMTSSTSPTQQEIHGLFRADINAETLEIKVDQLNFYRKIALNPGQLAAVQTIIDDAQASIEGGFITLGLIDGILS